MRCPWLLLLRAGYLGRNSLVKVDGKSIGTGPSGWRYAKVARACSSVMRPVIGQIWLTVAKACSLVSAVMLGYSFASSALARCGSVLRILVASANTLAT